MFDTIFIGTSGLLNHAKGLRIVGNNLANVNTPGFKSSQLQFANLFDQGSGHPSQLDGSGTLSQTGSGVASLGAQINFRAGLEQGTGNPLDLAINGNGFYTVKRGDELLYTRAGDFGFNAKGILVNSAGDHVQGLDSGGKLVDINLDTLERNRAKATSTVAFRGELAAIIGTPAVDVTVAGVTVLDANGVDRPLSLSIHNDGAGAYTVTVKDAANATVATGVIKFAGGMPVTGNSTLSFSYSQAGMEAQAVKLDFSALVNLPTSVVPIRVESQDGYAAGIRTDQTIGADGMLKVQYSNGQSATGARLALANFATESSLQEVGGSAFRKVNSATVHYGYAGADSFGKLVAGRREGSNVDLAEEFGNLILMQRGYQASSHVISTANDMIQQLFDMKGNR
jgi:flagellar hook protein FlgE